MIIVGHFMVKKKVGGSCEISWVVFMLLLVQSLK